MLLARVWCCHKHAGAGSVALPTLVEVITPESKNPCHLTPPDDTHTTYTTPAQHHRSGHVLLWWSQPQTTNIIDEHAHDVVLARQFQLRQTASAYAACLPLL
jgi:hypothetical protein